MPIGDVNSNERGSGARFNDGKPRLGLIPPFLLARGNDPELDHHNLLIALQNAMFDDYWDTLDEWLRRHMEWYAEECAAVFDYGSRKYASWNWIKGMKWSIPIDCALRHARALWVDNQENDPESGLPHRGHIMCNIVMLMYYRQYFPEGNDLPYKVLNTNG